MIVNVKSICLHHLKSTSVEAKIPKMLINNKFCFEKTVQSLARVLSQIKETQWESVS